MTSNLTLFIENKEPVPYPLQFLVSGGTPHSCSAGDSLITIMPNGDAYPCRRMPIRAGNVNDSPLTELYQKSPVLVSLRDKKKENIGCEGCSYTPKCRGGLKCLSFAMTGDPFHADPGCWLAHGKR